MTYTFLYLTFFTWPCLEIFYETIWYQLICQCISIGKHSGCPHIPTIANCWRNVPVLVSLCICARVFLKVKVKVTHLCPTLCDPMDYTVHGILQARMLEWVAFPFSRESKPRDRSQVSHIAGRFFTSWATREVTSDRMHVSSWVLLFSFIEK